MSVDEMCELVSKQTADANPWRLTGKEVLTIIAALKAGQAMRKDLRERTGKGVTLGSTMSWDYATKEGDV